MDLEASIEQVAGILVREGLAFETRDDGRGYRLMFDSAAVFIGFSPWRDGTVITLSSPILQDIDPGSPGAAAALNRINRLNNNSFFTKFVFDDGALIVEYDILADRLQSGELMNALSVVATSAEVLDDELVDEIGGKPFRTVLEEREGAGDADELGDPDEIDELD